MPSFIKPYQALRILHRATKATTETTKQTVVVVAVCTSNSLARHDATGKIACAAEKSTRRVTLLLSILDEFILIPR